MKAVIKSNRDLSTTSVLKKLDEIKLINDFLNDSKSEKVESYQNKIYRLFDIVFSASVLILLAPIYAVISLLIKINSPEAPVFFSHERIGLNGKIFQCYKFRTMIPDADKKLKELLNSNPEIKAEYEKDFKLKNDPRIIPVIGNLLRKTSLDELPQFFNVLKGDMSVVGPRPIVNAEKEKYGNHINTLLSVKPGITGLWQVSGRNDTSYDTRIMLDIKYIYNKNILLDLKLILKTILVVVNREGAY